MHEIKLFCIIYIFTLLSHISSSRNYNDRPISMLKFDQTNIPLEGEDRRDILRDIKTIYAPEYRIYANGSICNFNVKRKIQSPDSCSCNENILKDNEYTNQTVLLEKQYDGKAPKSSWTNNGMFGDFDNSQGRPKKFDATIFSHVPSEYETSSGKLISSGITAAEKMEGDGLLGMTSFWRRQLDTSQIRNIQSKTMQRYMNLNVDPCNDFYEYACGNWKNYYRIPPDRATYDTFEMARENLDMALKGLLEGLKNLPMKGHDHLYMSSFISRDFAPNDTSDATLKAGLFYKSCMQEDIITKRSDQPLKMILTELGGWPIISGTWSNQNFDIIWLLATLRLLNNDVLIAQWVGPDMKNSNEYIVHIDQTTLGLPAREYYLEDSNLKYVRAYKVFILTVAQLMGAQWSTAEKDTDDMVQFEVQLAQIMASAEERRNISEIYLRTDLSSLTLYFPQYNWKDYFDIVLGADIDLKTPVACYCARFLHKLLYLLSNTEIRTLQNYIIWRFVKHRTNNLDQRFMEAKQRFYYILFGREKNPPRWQFCVTQVNSNMGMALGSLFVKEYFDMSSKIDTIEMTKELEEAFKITLSENTWLDNNTKEYAKMKLDYMDLKIGFPDFLLNKTELDSRYYDVEIHQDYFFENVLIILRHLTAVEQRRLRSSVNRTLWSTPPAVVNAYYSRNKNQIMFPAGMLQPPFYNRHFPKALNFGGIGVVIGHEITHGFDDKGRLFDHEGNLHMWWRESSIEKFYEKSQCMIDQYGQYILPEIRIALDGYLTQGENIADNGGLKQAFRAYETWLKNHADADESLPGMNLTNRQLFFLNFAQVWCGQQRIEAAKSRIKTSVHSPGIFRVIGALSNSEEFSKVYKCPKNSPMNPEFKCIIW